MSETHQNEEGPAKPLSPSESEYSQHLTQRNKKVHVSNYFLGWCLQLFAQ